MKHFFVAFFLFIIIVSVQVAGGLLIYNSFSSWPIRGTFGDMFGAINALFSGLAFAGVIYAIMLQRMELSYQREDLKLAREAFALSIDDYKKSQEASLEQINISQISVKINALNHIITQLNHELSSMTDIVSGTPQDHLKRELTGKRMDLIEELKELYNSY